MRTHHRDDGMVTAEAAVVLPVLVLVLAVAVWVLACVTAQLRCVDAAREGARRAARGDLSSEVQAAARTAAPRGAGVTVQERGDEVVVVVSAQVAPFGGALRRLGAVDVEGRATALRESTVEGLTP
ncbi:MAG: TadE family protein [Frankiales bacterium]|nr:TadE family protein [Frankiales bacterium]